jgi:carbonic anhydrase
MKSGCALTLSCLAALLCLNLPLQAQVGDYPPWGRETSWEKSIEEYWKELKGHDEGYCGAGSNQPPQSPLDLKGWTEDKNLAPIRVSYDSPDYRYELERNAHTIEFRLIGSTRKVTIEGVDYRLLRFHFHHPSEHLINGERKAMEMHLVHQAADGRLAVLAVLLQAENIVFDSPWKYGDYHLLWHTMNDFERRSWKVKNLPQSVPRPDGSPALGKTSDMENFVLPPPGQRGYITYTGSLTTPDCRGNVTWVVFTTPIKVPWSRVGAFKSQFPANARWPQSLGTRQLKSKGTLE